MIPARFAPGVFGFFLSMIMSTTISAVGLSGDLPATWFRAWYSSWIVAFPAVLIVAPIARRIVGRLVAKPPA